MYFPGEHQLLFEIAGRLQKLEVRLKEFVAAKTAAMDFDTLRTRMKPEIQNLERILTDLREAKPDPADKFIAPDGQTPTPEQLSLQDFALSVASILPGKVSGFTTQDIALTGRGIERMLGILEPVVDAETYVRWYLNIRRKASPISAVTGLATAMIDEIKAVAAADSGTWPDGVPRVDSDKEAEEFETIIEKAPHGIRKVISRLMKGTRQSDRKIGAEVHRRIMEDYVRTHPTNLIVVDGRARLQRHLGPDGIVLSEIWESAVMARASGKDASANADKLATFWEALREPSNDKRIHPDISDLRSPAAHGRNPNDDWGWFEIKPWTSIPKGWTELYGYYLPKWNTHPGVMDQQWESGPGIWQPTTVFVLKGAPIVAAAITVPPGVIGYALFDVEQAASAAVAAALSTMAGLFVAKMIQQLRSTIGSLGQLDDLVIEFVGLWAAALALLVIVIFAGLELIAATGVEALIVGLASLLNRMPAVFETLGKRLPQLLPA